MTGANARPDKSDFRPAIHTLSATAETMAWHDGQTPSNPVFMFYPLDRTLQRGRDSAAPPRIGVSDVVQEVLRDCEQQGLVDELRQVLGLAANPDAGALRAVRDLVYELAGATDRELAVDALIYATGVAEFDLLSLRDYARKHGLSPEGFRQHVLALQHRLGLPPRPMQRPDAN